MSTGIPPRRNRRRRAWASLLWMAAFLAGFEALLLVAVERWYPEWRDPEFGYKLLRLRRERAKNPGRPLVVALGSSRTQLLFRPGVVVAALPPDVPKPVPFNFGIVGAGPVIEYMCLHRLLDHGIRPDCLVLEVLPPLLQQQEGAWVNVFRLGWRDWQRLDPYLGCLKTLYRPWRRAQFTGWYSYRLGILSRHAPTWLRPEVRADVLLEQMDRGGWLARGRNLTPAEAQRALEHARDEYWPRLQHFHVTDLPDRALRETLALCRREKIAVVFLIAPEGSEFQSWYPSAARAEIDAYLARLQAEFGVRLIDARDWVPDHLFADSHHVLREGADLFSERFGRTVLTELLQEGACGLAPSSKSGIPLATP